MHSSFAKQVCASSNCINPTYEWNIYGHPAPETLERLADVGCEIYETPQCGQITFYEKRGKWKLRAFSE